MSKELFVTKDGIPMQFMTIKEFCSCVGMSKPTWYRMENKPDFICLNTNKNRKMIRISRAAANKWVAKMEAACT